MLSTSSTLNTPISPSSKSFKKLKKFGISKNLISRRRGKVAAFRSEVAIDAPFAAAIGACVLSSLVSPISYNNEVDDENNTGGPLDSEDTRFAVMGIISFIPYFNWMSWVFAWLDSGKRRYLIYAVVYLAPYLRTNLSLSPEDSWLPIASIIFCIIHIQLEASIKNGDISSIQFFGKAMNLFGPSAKEEEASTMESHQESSKTFTTKKNPEDPSAHKIIEYEETITEKRMDGENSGVDED